MHLSISQAANHLGVSTSTLRLWEKSKKLIPSFRTSGGHRRYSLNIIYEMAGKKQKSDPRILLAYARVSCSDQRSDLERQKETLIKHCESKKENFELISDLGSGLNYKKRGLKKLIKLILTGQVQKIVLTHKDRLLRFGSEIIFHLCSFFNTQIELVHEEEEQRNNVTR